MNELAVDVLEAARRLSLGRTRFLELLKDGSIPSCLIGGRRVVRTADLETYVASLPVSPVGAASGTSAEVTGQETGRPVDIRAMSADEAAAHLANMRLAVADMVRSQDA